LAKACDLALSKPSISFSACMGNSFRQTVAGIFSNTKMGPSIMLEGHLSNTLQRAMASSGEYLIAAQDTTHYNYSGHKQMAGLGAIQGNVKGIMQHNVLLMNELGHPLGLVDQQYWTRKGGKDFGGKESLKWGNGLEAVNKHLGTSEKKVVLVQDREADIFDFFRAGRAPCVDLLVRVHQPRNMEVLANHVVAKLDTIGEHLGDFGTKEVLLERNHREVKLALRLKAGAVDVLSDKNGSGQTQGLSLVIAEEMACVDSGTGESVFNETDRAVWYLLTSLPIENGVDVERVVRFYALRWRVERLHYTLKSGALNVERLQFDDINSMVNALSFYSVVAWQLLALTYFVRQGAEAPASSVFEGEEIEILKKISRKDLQTVKQVVLALARVVGFAPSKKQPFPGVKVLAQALERLYFIKLGAWASQTKPLQD
jgi:Transposase DDE domain